jgi:hypothetical protein
MKNEKKGIKLVVKLKSREEGVEREKLSNIIIPIHTHKKKRKMHIKTLSVRSKTDSLFFLLKCLIEKKEEDEEEEKSITNKQKSYLLKSRF